MIERILSKAQSRAILSMVREREEIMRQANEQIAEINTALDEQAQTLRAAFGMPDGQYKFIGDVAQVVLQRMETPAAEAPVLPDDAPEKITGSAEYEDAPAVETPLSQADVPGIEANAS